MPPKKQLKKEIRMEITNIFLYPQSERERAETKIIYSYGDHKGEVCWVDPELGEIISKLTGLKIKKVGEV